MKIHHFIISLIAFVLILFSLQSWLRSIRHPPSPSPPEDPLVSEIPATISPSVTESQADTESLSEERIRSFLNKLTNVPEPARENIFNYLIENFVVMGTLDKSFPIYTSFSIAAGSGSCSINGRKFQTPVEISFHGKVKKLSKLWDILETKANNLLDYSGAIEIEFDMATGKLIEPEFQDVKNVPPALRDAVIASLRQDPAKNQLSDEDILATYEVELQGDQIHYEFEVGEGDVDRTFIKNGDQNQYVRTFKNSCEDN